MESLLRKFCVEPDNRLKVLAEIVMVLRPADSSDILNANKNISGLIDILETDTELKDAFSAELARFISQLNTRRILTENGILPPTAFQKELKNRIGRRILPPLLEKEVSHSGVY